MAQHDRYETDILDALRNISSSLESIIKTLKAGLEEGKEEVTNPNEYIDEKTGEKLVGCYIVFIPSEADRIKIYNEICSYYCSTYITCQISDFDKALILFNDVERKVQSIIHVRVEDVNKIRGFRPKAYFFAINRDFNYQMRDEIKSYLGRDKEVTYNLDRLLDLAFFNRYIGEEE